MMLELKGKENGYTFTIRQLTDGNFTENEYFTFMTDKDGKIIEYYTIGAEKTLEKLYTYIKPHLSKVKII